MWKNLYRPSSGDYGTLSFFRNKLGRVAVTKEPKKDVNATIDFLSANVAIPPELKKATAAEQLGFIMRISEQIVERLTLVDSSFFVTMAV